MGSNQLRPFYLLLFCCTFSLWGYSQLQLPKNAADDYPLLNINALSRFIDSSNTRSDENIWALYQQGAFRNQAVQKTNNTITQWYALEVENQDSFALSLPLRICNEASNVYALIGMQTPDSALNAIRVNPNKRRTLELYLPPNSKRLVLVKARFKPEIPSFHLDELLLPAPAVVSKSYLFQASTLFFLSGLLLFLCLLGLVSAWFFKEKAFLFFALLMFFFVPYFMLIKNIDFVLVRWFPNIGIGYLINFSLSAILISAYLFVSSYLNLSSRLPRFNRFYLILSAVVPLYMIVERLINPLEVTSSNIALGIWVLCTLYPAIYLSSKGVQAGKVFLLSCGLLLATSLLFVLNIIGLFPFPGIALNGFQIGSLLFSITLFYDLFTRVSSIRNEKRKFEELDSLKSIFFENISHELRTPLTLMVDPIKRIAAKTTSPEDKVVLERAHQNGLRLVDLIDQILELTQLENGKMQLKAQEQNIVPLVKGISGSFASLAEGKSISLKVESSATDIRLFVESEKLHKILQNLLSNAFKFVPNGGAVNLNVTEDAQQVYLTVRDNGSGIKAESLPFVFDRFYQSEGQEEHYQKGSGIGLALVKELVQLHHGTIEVSSTPNKETSFSIAFKKGRAHLTDDQVIQHAKSPQDTPLNWEVKSTAVSTAPDINLQAPLKNQTCVLVVEDHPDVMEYICSHLKPHFKVVQAVHGEEGIEKAQELLPDLIISDVMMPYKDGYALVHELKQTLLTSHIPIILLSAKASQDEKLKGLKTKADDYLTKPFDAEELLTRAQNLIEQRQKLRSTFSQQEKPLGNKTNLSKVDQTFVFQLNQTLETHFADPLFSVEEFSTEVGLSKVHLNRKLNALFDLSANKLIQQFRLQKAKEMLLAKEGNVSEVAFKSGFNSIAYFVKCFKEKYNSTPGTFLE